MLPSEIAKTFVINLPSRKERWSALEEAYDKLEWVPGLTRTDAFDGMKYTPPAWWTQGAGAWGCYQSHLRILERAIEEDLPNYWVLEDDAIFVPDFNKRLEPVLAELPDDWHQLYLGGQHIEQAKAKPFMVGEHIVRCFNINRTHSFMIHKRFYADLYTHLWDAIGWSKNKRWHVDHWLGQLHQRETHNVYGVHPWMVGQGEGKSDICKIVTPAKFWHDHQQIPKGAEAAKLAEEAGLRQRSVKIAGGEKVTRKKKESGVFVAVLGVHRSGSSCVAGTLFQLGVHMGNHLGGGGQFNPKGSFEAQGLARICEQYMQFPNAHPTDEVGMKRELTMWAKERMKEADQRGTIAGGKYPHMCRVGDAFADAAPNLKIVFVDRPIKDSIASLDKRGRAMPEGSWLAKTGEDVEHIQKSLWKAREAFVRDRDYHKVNYNALLENPEREVDKLIEYLGIHPTPGQRQLAIQFADPKLRTVHGTK